MSILARGARLLANRNSGAAEQRTLTTSAFIPPPSSHGAVEDFVGVHRALSCMTVLACVRLLADTIASLPWKAYKRDTNGVPKEVNPQPALLRQPFPGFDLFQWKWMVVAAMALRGNSYHLITSRDKLGYPTSLLPLHPDMVFLERRPDILMWFDPIYRLMGEEIPTAEIIHIRRFTLPGEAYGLSPIRQAAAAIGMSLASEDYGHRFFRDSATPSGILFTDKDLDEGAVQRQQKNWIASNGGRRLPAVLTSGFKWETIVIKPNEAQFLECVVAGTLITMADGTRVPVEDLRLGDEVMGWNGSKLESAPVRAIGKPPVKEIVKVVTARGRELICTADHPLLALTRIRTPGGRPVADTTGDWIAAGELRPGNYVRVALGHLPTEAQDLSEDISYFLGAMVGDGYIRSASCTWSSATDAVTERMRDAVESLGGRLSYKDRYDYAILTGGVGRAGSPIRGILNESELVGCRSHEKFVPDMITRGGRRAWCAFLSAYFDADGSIRDPAGKQTPAAYWASTSRGLLDDCQHLLALMGINSAVYRMGAGGSKTIMGQPSTARPSWGLYVSGLSELAKLAEALELAHPEKRRRLLSYSGAASKYRASNFEYDAVTSVEHMGPGQAIGVEIGALHTHVTGGLISHNTRQFQRSDICLLYGVPPILIGDTKETTAWGTGVEQITLGAITFTFRAWTACMESIISGCLPRGQFVRFDFDALLRGDVAGRWTAYQKAIGSSQGAAWVTANELRAREEMDPIEGGDVLLHPMTMVPAGSPVALGNPPPGAKPPGGLPMPPIGGGESGDRAYAYYDHKRGMWLAATSSEPVPGLWQADGSFYSFDPLQVQGGEDVDGAERYAGVGGASSNSHGKTGDTLMR